LLKNEETPENVKLFMEKPVNKNLDRFNLGETNLKKGD